ncbi:MAG: hypothetical protein A3A73_05645 [Omnitrophica bacterium RIFCSPLOWO2_01_FULL_50_24]|nr:MAG: hypothetical protein A3A73_05645 [Omnitrophica bacterium RIFCSPLOWO2_01_FULL_50_24]
MARTKKRTRTRPARKRARARKKKLKRAPKRKTVKQNKAIAPPSPRGKDRARSAVPKREKILDVDQTLDKTPMKIYLQQIEKIPLLTPEEEISLSKSVMTGGEEGVRAREQMIRSNLRLVISIVKRYANLGLPFSDMVEEGNIGLMRAVDKFNYRKGYRFSTYASWWIKQAIMRALSNQGKTIRVPVYMYDTISKWRKIRDALVQKLSRFPSTKEIADAMKLSIEKVKEIERIGSQPGSLNAPVSLEGTAEMLDVIADESAASPMERVEDLFEGERIDQLLNYVDERERQVLILRFGLKGGEPKTLEETAKHFDVTRERIRQIEFGAIKKIRDMLKLKEEKKEDYVR